MSFLTLAKRRYSVRKYQEKAVEEEKLQQILEAGRVAPSAANNQPCKLIVVKEKAGIENLGKAAKIYNAPLYIIVCGDHHSAWVRSYDQKNTVDIDSSIVTDHMMLKATDLGLGTLWICYFDPKIIQKEFNIPEHIEPVNILAIGYADGEKTKSPDRHHEARKPLKDIVLFESF